MTSFDNAVARLTELLNASSALDLMFWSSAELYVYTGNAAQRLSLAGIFIERSTTTATQAGSAGYALPFDALGVVHASVAGSALNRRNARELDALSGAWMLDTAASAKQYILDYTGLNTIRLYPTPTVGGETLAVVFQATVGTVTAQHRALQVVEDYLVYFALGDARAKTSDAAMPDIVGLARERAALIASVCQGYWGTGNV